MFKRILLGITLSGFAFAYNVFSEPFELSNGVTGHLTYPTFTTTNPIGFNGYLLDEGSSVCFEQWQARNLLGLQYEKSNFDTVTTVTIEPEYRSNNWIYIIWQANGWVNGRIQSPDGNWYELVDTDGDTLLTACFPQYDSLGPRNSSYNDEELKLLVDKIIEQKGIPVEGEMDLFSVCLEQL